MNATLQERIADEMAKLPAGHRQAINAFDWARKCQEVGAEHNLLEDEISGLQAEVALVLMGLSDVDTLHRYIDVEIGGTGWEDIEAKVVQNILTPISEILDIIMKYDG